MQNTYTQLAVVIPSLEPKEDLIDYVSSLLTHGFTHIYVVNDGSSHSYNAIFQSLSNIEGCTILIHDKNRGKGAALKTAYAFIVEDFPQCCGVITADSDGQHTVADVCKIADALLQSVDSLILGERDFSMGNTPLKSYLGNRVSSAIFRLLHGKWVGDTQTGLRGFAASLLPKMLSISGERFEYEMAVLTTFTSQKVPIHVVPIDTIYIEGNASTHFRPLVDSLQIGGILLGRLCRFIMSSGISCMIDISICWLLFHLFTPLIESHLLRIGLSVVMARLISMLVNYTINKGFVFRATNHGNQSFYRYILLVVANLVVAIISVYTLRTLLYMDERLAKVLVDIILFTINYQIQRIWVFPFASTGGKV